MCQSLVINDQRVDLIVADGNSDEICEGVNIIDAGASKGRLDRILNAPRRVFEKAVALDADLYHLHDPELIPIGLKLKKIGKRVIFDSHEDVPLQMLSKPYLTRPIRWGISRALSFYEAWACEQFDGVIAATPFIRDKFLRINPNSIDINNFPLLDELASASDWGQKQPFVCYVGGIDEVRGIVEMIQAIGQVQSPVNLGLAGRFGDPSLYRRVTEMSGWQRIEAKGFLNREGVRDLLSRSMAGLVTLHPLINYLDALPVKMFEYMSGGIPVIASDFPLWREIVVGNDCGLVVDPLNSDQIAEAIDYLVTHPADAERMGRNGRNAVLKKYNWANEEQKLLNFYRGILGA